jgi:transposase
LTACAASASVSCEPKSRVERPCAPPGTHASTVPVTCSLRGRERLTEPQGRRLCELFSHDPVIAEAWGLKELLRSVYAAPDRAEAKRRLERFFAEAARSGCQPFEAYVNGISPWREEILAYFDQPASNGYAEGVINKVKVIKRRAYGLPSFESFRERVLVACG